MEKPKVPKFLAVPAGKEANLDRAHQIAIYIDAAETAKLVCRGLADEAQSMAAKTWKTRTQQPTEGPTEYHHLLLGRNAKRIEDHYTTDCNAYAGMLGILGDISRQRHVEALNDYENDIDRGAELRQQDLHFFQDRLSLLTPEVIG